MALLFVPVTAARLAGWVMAGVLPGEVRGHAVTAGLQAAFEPVDADESERIALLAGRQAVPIINKSLFSSVRILVPKLPEQHRIASFLSSIETLLTDENQSLELLKAHKKGLMQQIFPSLESISA